MPKVQTGARASVIVPLEPVPAGKEPQDVAHIAFKPWATYARAAGQGFAAEAVKAGEDTEVAAVAFTIGAARWGAVSWVGVGDDDGGPLELTHDNLQLLLEQDEAAYRAVDELYVIPALQREQEKNASAPSQDGTSPA